MPLGRGPARRTLILGGAAGLFAATGVSAARTRADIAARLDGIEAAIGGRVGVAAVNTGTEAWVAHRADERFAMCSTFKALLAGAVLARVDRRELSLARRVTYSAADLLNHAPRTQAHLAAGAMSVDDLCAAAVEVSDNTAANLLLALVGGPNGLTQWLRGAGDGVTRLDRAEPTLNTNVTDDPRDTSTPRAFAGTLRRLLLGQALSLESRGRLTDWMVRCETGEARLRAGAPRTWKAADKTGTGERGAINDVAVFWPPARPPIVIAAFLSGSSRPVDDLNAAHADIARAVVAALA